MINAKETRKLSESYMTEKASINSIEKQIMDAALEGKFNISVGTMSEFVRSYLKQHDYTITPQSDPKDGDVSYYRISWGKETGYR